MTPSPSELKSTNVVSDSRRLTIRESGAPGQSVGASRSQAECGCCSATAVQSVNSALQG